MKCRSFFAIIFSMVTIGTTVENFCKDFLENNNTIDYQYDHRMSFRVIHLLFIGQRYWSVETHTNPQTFEFELTMDSNSFGESDWFGHKYITGFSIWSNRFNSYITGLVQKNKSSDQLLIDWGIFSENTSIGLKNASPVHNFNDINSSHSFVSVVSTSGNNFVLFVNITKNGIVLPNKEVVLSLNGSTAQLSQVSNGVTDQISEEPMFSKDMELIGRFFLLNMSLNEAMNTGIDVVTYLLIDDQRIVYCFGSLHSNEVISSQTCLEQNLKTLINCKEYPILGIGTKKLLISLVILLVGVIFIAIAIYYMVFYRRVSKRLADESVESLSHSADDKDGSASAKEPIVLTSNTIMISKFKSEEMLSKESPESKTSVLKDVPTNRTSGLGSGIKSVSDGSKKSANVSEQKPNSMTKASDVPNKKTSVLEAGKSSTTSGQNSKSKNSLKFDSNSVKKSKK